MSEQILSKLWTVAGPLLGVVVGGLISSLTSRSLERQRWRHDRQERLAALRREALAATLEWIEPMRNAEIRASSLVRAALGGDFEHERFFKEFPYLLGDLIKMDLPADQRAVLPDDVYVRGHRIVRKLDELRGLGVKYGQEARVKGKLMAGFQECSAKLDIVGKEISQLEEDLRKAFNETFE